MDLDLTEEQELLRDALRGLCTAESGTNVVRAAELNPKAAASFKDSLANMGIPGLRIAPEQGGSGLGMTELVVANIELGRAMAPGPYFENGVVSASLLSALSGDVAKALLGGIADGSKTIITAWQEDEGRIDPAMMLASVSGENGAYRLNGKKQFVPHLDFADKLLVLARHPGNPDRRVVCVVDPADASIGKTAQPNLADEPLTTLRFSNTPVETVIGLDGDVDAAWEKAFNDCMIGMAALAVGGAERILEITVQYACEREQFGKPIGSFQAIAHYLADAAVQVEGARTLVYRAASAADEGAPFRHYALMAKLKACKVYRDVSATSIQVHGGLGFTLEADPQLFFRRAKHYQLMYGDPAWLERKIADGLFSGQHPVFDQ